MGSQTLEILRQGVWASLTGGWFYDPHQGVFCNVVHLYLWLYLLCSPFVAYLYFPGTWATWCVYCVLTSATILLVKLANMALHRLYDRAQTMSEANLKHQFFKITKETEPREDETGIELKVIRNDGSRNSVERAINEASEENSMMSIDNLNSIIDLKVDVHRKNSSESIEMMFYAAASGGGQDQHSIAGSASVSKSMRSTTTTTTQAAPALAAGLPVYEEHEGEAVASTSAAAAAAAAGTACSIRQPHLLRKSSEDFKRRHQRRRLERQSSLDAAAEATIVAKLMRRQQSDTIATASSPAARIETFLHSQTHPHHVAVVSKAASVAVVNTSAISAASATTTAATVAATAAATSTVSAATNAQRPAAATSSSTSTKSTSTTSATTTATMTTPVAAGTTTPSAPSNGGGARSSRLQRHRSSETHDERQRHQNRALFLPIHHEHHRQHHRRHQGSTTSSSNGALAAPHAADTARLSDADADELELSLGGGSSIGIGIGSASGGIGGFTTHGGDNRVGPLPAWILGSSSDVCLEDDDDNYTKSDFGIEQLDGRSSSAASRAAFLLQQQQQLNSHYQHQQQFRSHHHHPHPLGQRGVPIRKDSNSTVSALQLPVASTSAAAAAAAAASGVRVGMKRRRHSNATTTMFKSGGAAGSSAAASSSTAGQQSTVRRIKSAALEIACPRPSVSNLSAHPNSVEAINGQQQIRNPQSALLPPPSQYLVRNPHLNLCPKLGGSFGSGLSFNTALDGQSSGAPPPPPPPSLEPVYPIEEQADEKTPRDQGEGELKVIDIEGEDEQEREEDNDDNDERGAASGGGAAALDCGGGAVDDLDDVDVDDEDIDADDPLGMRRRHRALGCHKRSAESDVGGILADILDADDDEFKDFDFTFEHMLQDTPHTELSQLRDDYAAHSPQPQRDFTFEHVLQDLQDTHNELDLLHAASVAGQSEAPSTSRRPEEVLRQHSHSTDSETDNNGSRSPLLSKKKQQSWNSRCDDDDQPSTSASAADKALRLEIAAVQRQPVKPLAGSANFPQHMYEMRPQNVPKSEADSGCPSSDCEQVSASSKDMLLEAMDAAVVDLRTRLPGAPDTPELRAPPKDLEGGNDSSALKSEAAGGSSAGKSLGAIPKVVKYREIDETRRGEASTSQHLHRRRSGTGAASCSFADRPCGGSKVVAAFSASRTSSSNSSHSISSRADSFSTDIHKMLWVMYGGEVDDSGRPIAGVGPDGAPIAAGASVVPPKMSSAHFQFYQDAIQSLSTNYPGSSMDGLSPSERIYFRDKIRRGSKQISEPGALAAAGGDASLLGGLSHEHAEHLLQSVVAASSAAERHSHAASRHGGAPSGSSVSAALSGRNVSSAATLSIQGLISVINDERQLAQGRTGSVGGAGGTTTAAILNVDGRHIDSYCDYWRPACHLAAEKHVPPKSFYRYRFRCCGYEHEFKISMDRLELLALFDRDLHWLHVLLAVVLCAMVAYIGASILQLGYYRDLFAFLFCAVIAGAQYSLVKSVQPDAASPVHGFNKTVAYSRAIYFSMCGWVLLLLERLRCDYEQAAPTELSFFGMRYAPAELTLVGQHVMFVLLLCFPLIFSLGLFPQINTFLMYLLEQIDMHVFGGNAAGSLLGSFLCVLRSLLGVMLLYGPLYAALAEGRGTQFILFSIFCAMLVPLGYHLSRSASDFSHVWALVKHCIVSTYRDDDDEEMSGATAVGSSQKLTPSAAAKKSARRDKAAAASAAVSGAARAAPAGAETIEMSSLEKVADNGETAAEPEEAAAEGGDEEADEEERLNEEREREQELQLDGKSSKSKGSSLGGSSQTLAKTLSSSKKAMTASSSSYTSVGMAVGGATGSSALNASDGAVGGTISADEGAKCLPPNDEDDGEAEAEKASTSASTTNPGDISTLTAGGIGGEGPDGEADADAAIDASYDGEIGADVGSSSSSGGGAGPSESPDPLPKKLQATVNTRLKNDLVVTTLLALAMLGLHSSTVFTVLQPDLNIVLYAFTGALGLLLHYVIPQMRKHMPWLCFARPMLRPREFAMFEVTAPPKIMWYEKVYIYLCMIERNVLFPLLCISALTADAQTIALKFGVPWGALIVAVCALKFIRNAYSDPTNQYLIVMFTVLFFGIDFSMASETFLIDYFFVSLAFRKCCDFLLKLQFIVTYIAPWQITWGSAFHAFAQPFSVPHSAMLFLQAAVSALLSTPLNPFLGSAIFLTSYVRPIKFWERDYNTRRIDHSNTRLSSQLERDLGADDNNLNSIFYEHLTRSLQHSLCGDLLMGRWGNVNQGDCFVLASDYLNCLVHIIELGNGLCTFQMRGLEFRGTYCQQREVEAITEEVHDNDGFCCCDPGHLPRTLSVNAMFSTRWLAWQVVAKQYVLEGYSISDNLASATLQVFEYRKVLITYYIKSIIYYVIKNPKLEQWLASAPIQDALQHTLGRHFVDLDPIFNYNVDEDFDFRAVGITRSSFCYVYLNWINYCCDKRKESQAPTPAQPAQPAPASAPPAAVPPTTTTTSAHNTPSSGSAHNDSKSTPNLSTTTTTTLSAARSRQTSTQQLRSSRPQKSATMSGSGAAATGGDAATSGGGVSVSGAGSSSNYSAEHIASSQSFANISRQTTSESAPGLTMGGFYTRTMAGSCLRQTSLATNTSQQQQQQPQQQQSQSQHQPSQPPSEESPTPGDRRTAAGSGRSGGGGGSGSGSKAASIKLRVPSIAKDAPIVSLCLALGLLARRSLATASQSALTGVEFFLHGLHALFKGDFRITSPRDEWVFADMELLHAVIAPAVKMALKLQQDHISNPDEFCDPAALYTAIDSCAKDLVISHEADPVWRSAVLRGAPNLLALRHVMEDGSDEYRIIRLTKRFLSFRVIKLNRECVRGLWAGQQQELIYLRNRNPERGSIQNAKQALRNIINSSCDQPIGYPIYVSPLTTSYADTNDQLRQVIGGAITLDSIRGTVLAWWQRIREHCRQGCSSGSALDGGPLGPGGVGGLGGSGGCSSGAGGESGEVGPAVYISAPLYNTLQVGNLFGLRANTHLQPSLASQFGSDGLATSLRAPNAPPLPPKPTSTTLLAGLLSRERELEVLREARGLRKSQTQQSAGAAAAAATAATGSSSGRGERERRATLPIASTSMGVSGGSSGGGAAATGGSLDAEQEDSNEAAMCSLGSSSAAGGGGAGASGNSPRYAKISCSSGSLGIASIITTPGDYPRKSKGPICLTAAAAAAAAAAASGSDGGCDAPALPPRRLRVEVYKKVIIVDDTEIYDCLDLGRHIDVVWPSEEMRAAGGRQSWKEWQPHAGMVGYVVHCWLPNHSDARFRSHVNRPVYLVQIGRRFVPVGEYGIREYNQIVDSAESSGADSHPNSRRNSLQSEMEREELRQQRLYYHQLQQHHTHAHPYQAQSQPQQQPSQSQREGLTPILGSSLESPTSQLAAGSGMGASGSGGTRPKIQAVSSSSSEEEDDDDDAAGEGSNRADRAKFELQRHDLLLSMWQMMIAEKRSEEKLEKERERERQSPEPDYTAVFQKMERAACRHEAATPPEHSDDDEPAAPVEARPLKTEKSEVVASVSSVPSVPSVAASVAASVEPRRAEVKRPDDKPLSDDDFDADIIAVLNEIVMPRATAAARAAVANETPATDTGTVFQVVGKAAPTAAPTAPPTADPDPDRETDSSDA